MTKEKGRKENRRGYQEEGKSRRKILCDRKLLKRKGRN